MKKLPRKSCTAAAEGVVESESVVSRRRPKYPERGG